MQCAAVNAARVMVGCSCNTNTEVMVCAEGAGRWPAGTQPVLQQALSGWGGQQGFWPNHDETFWICGPTYIR
jgi:hypothetical protein